MKISRAIQRISLSKKKNVAIESQDIIVETKNVAVQSKNIIVETKDVAIEKATVGKDRTKIDKPDKRKLERTDMPDKRKIQNIEVETVNIENSATEIVDNENTDETINQHKIYVGNLPFKFKETDVLMLFKDFGKILDINIRRKGSHSLGYAFLIFENSEDADRAIKNMHESEVQDRRIRVERGRKAVPKSKKKEKLLKRLRSFRKRERKMKSEEWIPWWTRRRKLVSFH